MSMSLEKVLEQQFQIQEQLFKIVFSKEEYFKAVENALKYSYGFQLNMWKLWLGCNKA